MSGQPPLFSVVIPTRNRAHLLRYALRSALEQTFDDYEVVVSDNHCEDDTPQVVRELATSRVRYVRTDRALSMPDHWEFALDHARGEYITYLCDDDAVSPGLLREMAGIIAARGSVLLMSPCVQYFAPAWSEGAWSELRNAVTIPPCSGETKEYDARSTLRGLFGCDASFLTPRMLNSFCRRDVVSGVRKEAGRIFLLSPDYSFAAMILTGVDRWALVDRPLRLHGVFPESIGASYAHNRAGASREFLRELGQASALTRVPLSISVVANFIAETLLRAKERLPSRLRDFDIDWVRYFTVCWELLLSYERAGVSVEAEKLEFHRVLARQPAQLRSAVLAAIAPSGIRRLRHTARRMINASPLLTRLEGLVRRRKRGGGLLIVHGDEGGFSNILECARKLHVLSAKT